MEKSIQDAADPVTQESAKVPETDTDATPSNEARLTEIQALVVDLIHVLLSSDIADVDAYIDDCLARIGKYAKRDRAYIFVRDGDHADNTHEWCAVGIPAMIEQLQGLSLDEYSALFDPLIRNDVILIPDIDDFLPGSPEHDILAAQEIRSLLLVPMLEGTEFFGFVGFDSVAERGDFLPGEVYLLRAFADVIRSVLLRRSATEELARERAFLQGIVSTTAAGLLVLDSDGTIIFANDACKDVLGVPVEMLIGRNCDSPDWELMNLEGRHLSKEDRPFHQVMRTGSNVTNCRVAMRVDDQTRYVSINAAPIPADAASSSRVLYAVSDVTALVRAEQSREAALAEARRANETKSNFLAKMSHELRTPLNGVLGITEILADTAQDANQLQLITILHDSGQLLMNIINDLLDMTRIEANALHLEQIPFSLSELARRTEEVHTLRASEKRLSFAVMLDDRLGAPRLGDPHRLMQILHNLISNALKFTEAGHVTVMIRAPDRKQVVIEVSDSGIGMSAAQQIKVLEPFTQADASISRRFGGTGLGMSIVKSLTELFGGTLEIDSRQGDGTRVTVRMPLAVAPNSSAEPSTPAPVSAQALADLSVLAVDDNRTNLVVLSMMLGRIGANVVLAGNGREALEAFGRESFDLVICDISMPEMDGITLLRVMRQMEQARSQQRTPAIAFTANAMTHQVESYLASGFNGCLTKPVNLASLVDVLGSVLLRHPPVAAAESSTLS